MLSFGLMVLFMQTINRCKSLFRKMNWWTTIVDYYKTIGEKYSVDPVIFVGIHIVATPLFAASVWWIVHNRKTGRSIIVPVIIATLVFNAANIYLIVNGKDIPWWIYGIVAATTILSSFITIKKIKARLNRVSSSNGAATTTS